LPRISSSWIPMYVYTRYGFAFFFFLFIHSFYSKENATFSHTSSPWSLLITTGINNNESNWIILFFSICIDRDRTILPLSTSYASSEGCLQWYGTTRPLERHFLHSAKAARIWQSSVTSTIQDRWVLCRRWRWRWLWGVVS
jgi:hypothetical protein